MDSVFVPLKTCPRNCLTPAYLSSQVGTAPRAVLCAKVQIGLRPVQRCKREGNLQVTGLGPQVSGTGFQLQVRVPEVIQNLNLYPNLKT